MSLDPRRRRRRRRRGRRMRSNLTRRRGRSTAPTGRPASRTSRATRRWSWRARRLSETRPRRYGDRHKPFLSNQEVQESSGPESYRTLYLMLTHVGVCVLGTRVWSCRCQPIRGTPVQTHSQDGFSETDPKQNPGTPESFQTHN